MKNDMDISHKLHYINKQDIKIFPIFDIDHNFAVKIEDPHDLVFKTKSTTGEFKHSTRTINKAIEDTLIFVYNKLTDKKERP